eukprot:UN06908
MPGEPFLGGEKNKFFYHNKCRSLFDESLLCINAFTNLGNPSGECIFTMVKMQDEEEEVQVVFLLRNGETALFRGSQ